MPMKRDPPYVRDVADEKRLNVKEAKNRPRPAFAIEKVRRNIENVRFLAGVGKTIALRFIPLHDDARWYLVIPEHPTIPLTSRRSNGHFRKNRDQVTLPSRNSGFFGATRWHCSTSHRARSQEA